MDNVKRLHYFTGQFLQEQDFIDEQNYFIDRLKNHQHYLHTPGVADITDRALNEKLKVTGQLEATKVTVASGIAFDGEGNQIVLIKSSDKALNDQALLTKLTDNENSLLIGISYAEEITDPSTYGQGTRWTESGNVQLILEQENPSDAKLVRLAKLKVSKEGKLLKEPEDIRQLAGQQTISDGSISENKLEESIQNKLSLAVNALSNEGGKVTGRVEISKNVGGIRNSSSPTFKDKGVLSVLNTVATQGYGLVAIVAETEETPPRDTNQEVHPAAIVAFAGRDNVYGIYATALSDSHALYVDGNATITGRVVPSHTVDVFINASGQRLKKGDVVKLKGTAVQRYRGIENQAPIAEVTFVDKENDPLVIGIVDCEAIPDPGKPDNRIEPEDPSFIENGGDLYVVTLGVFAYCKADATKNPIQVGDLLTTSDNPGHAMKAIKPKLGCIIGKALEPLESGTGEISVFVNIQ